MFHTFLDIFCIHSYVSGVEPSDLFFFKDPRRINSWVHLHVVSGGMEALHKSNITEKKKMLAADLRGSDNQQMETKWHLSFTSQTEVDEMTWGFGIKLEYLFYLSLKIAQKNIPDHITLKCLPAPQQHESATLSLHPSNKRPSLTGSKEFDFCLHQRLKTKGG